MLMTDAYLDKTLAVYHIKTTVLYLPPSVCAGHRKLRPQPFTARHMGTIAQTLG